MFRQFIYFLVLLFSVQAENAASAAPKRINTFISIRNSDIETAIPGIFFDQQHPCNGIGRFLIAHAKKKVRFRIPDSSARKQEGSADLQKPAYFTLVAAINGHYTQSDFSSQQYSFLFRLTPF